MIGPTAVSRAFADLINRAGPYGRGNPEPVFVLADMRGAGAKAIGKDHLAVSLVSTTGEKLRAVAFRCGEGALAEKLKSGRRLHIAGKVRADDFRGGGAAQFQIVDAADAL